VGEDRVGLWWVSGGDRGKSVVGFVWRGLWCGDLLSNVVEIGVELWWLWHCDWLR